jgi:AAA domain
MELQRASRKKAKIKILLSSPTGFGKTYSALLMAYGLTDDWSKIAVIDTENRSASLYSHLGAYYTIEMIPPFTIENFVKAVNLCVESGMQVIIADSVTHYWGQVKDYVDTLGGGFQNWKKGTPMWQRLMNTILQTDIHFICTARKKQAYEMSQGENGKLNVKKLGMEDQIRDGFDYEMTIALELINDKHLARCAKDRTELFDGGTEFIINPETGKRIKKWCESGAEPTKLPLTNTAFAKCLERINAGEIEIIKKMKDTYMLTEEQISTINALNKV